MNRTYFVTPSYSRPFRQDETLHFLPLIFPSTHYYTPHLRSTFLTTLMYNSTPADPCIATAYLYGTRKFMLSFALYFLSCIA